MSPLAVSCLCGCHLALMSAGRVITFHDSPRSASSRGAWLVWAIYAASIAGIVLFSSRSETSFSTSQDAIGNWLGVVTAITVSTTCTGLLSGADPGRLFLLAGGCGVISGLQSEEQYLVLLILLFVFPCFSARRSWTTICSAILIGLGILLLNSGQRLTEPLLDPIPLQSLSLILVLAGVGGLTGWFPFPVLVQPEDSREETSETVLQFLLKCLICLSLIVRISDQLTTENLLGLMVIAITVPAFLTGIRLLNPETPPAYIQRRCFVVFSTLLAPLSLTVWQRSREVTGLLETQPGFWSEGNLLSGLSLLDWGVLVEWISLLLLILTYPQDRDPGESATQAPDEYPASRSKYWFGLALWISSGIPPSPVFWWRFQLLASLSVAHRQSSLTRLVEPHPLFLLLMMILAVAWTLCAAGAWKLWLKLSMERPTPSPRHD